MFMIMKILLEAERSTALRFKLPLVAEAEQVYLWHPPSFSAGVPCLILMSI